MNEREGKLLFLSFLLHNAPQISISQGNDGGIYVFLQKVCLEEN